MNAGPKTAGAAKPRERGSETRRKTGCTHRSSAFVLDDQRTFGIPFSGIVAKEISPMKHTKKMSVGARIVQGLGELADTLAKGERVSEKFTCASIELDLAPSAYDSTRVKETRQLLHASQAVFATFLGVSVNTVRAWEQGINSPNDIARRFMDEIRLNPEYWMRRLRKTAVAK